MKLKDRIAIITGATSGIGEASALLFAEEGAKVTVTGRDEERGRNVVGAITAAGGTAIFVQADVRLPGDCERIVTETLRAFGGRLDILFNNAGVYYPHNAIDCTEEEWDATVDSSLKGAWLMSKYSLPTMIAQGRGVIINQASGWGIQGGDRGRRLLRGQGRARRDDQGDGDRSREAGHSRELSLPWRRRDADAGRPTPRLGG